MESVSGAPRGRVVSPERGRRPPDFFIVGHPKSGTTALYEMLAQHPQIYMSAVKEPHYFAWNNPLPEGTDGRRWRSLDQTGTHRSSLDEYLSLFADAGANQKTGEASTSYLWSAAAPEGIAAVNPSARIIAIFREPAAFLRALHQQLIANGQEVESDFRTAFSLDDERRQGRSVPDDSVWPMALIYSDRVAYVEQLRRYEAVFPREQMLVLIYDDYRRDNEGTLRQVLRFLEVDETVALPRVETQQAVRVRSPRIVKVMRRLRTGEDPVSRVARAATKAVTPSADVRLRIGRKILFSDPAPADEEFARELRRRFKPEVLALSEHLDRDLVSLWGYEDVD